MTEYAIEAMGLSKRFKVNRARRSALKELAVRGRAPAAEEFWALRDASFTVPRGQAFGIIGHNGSGKSTALKVIAGIYRPTSGTVQVNGRISALLELGAGFHPELTGRENIGLNGAILGLSKAEIRDATDAIIEFSGIEDFIDSPVKHYSSGMYVRLGFAIAIHVQPEILVIDEVIAVGDEEFQRKCFDYMHRLKQRGSTIVIVTHSMALVEEFCDTAVWLDHGVVRAQGPSRDVVRAYLEQVNRNEATHRVGTGPDDDASIERTGSGEVTVEWIELLRNDEPGGVLEQHAAGTIRLHYRAATELHDAIFGLGFFTDTEISIAGPNSARIAPCTVPAGAGYVDFHMPAVLLAPATYRLSTSVVSNRRTIDMIDRGFALTVRGADSSEPGLVFHPGTWSTPTITTT